MSKTRETACEAALSSPIANLGITSDDGNESLSLAIAQDISATTKLERNSFEDMFDAPDTNAEGDAGEWIEAHEAMWQRLCRSYSKSFQGLYDMDDLLQEVRIAVYRAWGSFNPNRIDVKRESYYWVVAENQLKMMLRKTRTQKRMAGDRISIESIDACGDGDDAPTAYYRGADVQRANDRDVEDFVACSEDVQTEIGKLPVRYAKVMTLHMQGYTQEDIKKVLNVCQATVSYRLSNSRKRIKEAMRNV